MKLKILTFSSTTSIFNEKAKDSPLYPSIGEYLNKNQNIKNIALKLNIYDVATNGGKYFYKNIRPMNDLKNQFTRANPNKPGEDSWSKKKKDTMNFIEFYRHQYAFSPNLEDLYTLNKLTTPKENIRKLRKHKQDRDKLSEFDFPISLLSPNPLGIHYFELFSLSIAMYTRLKEEFRTCEFIRKYFSQISIYTSKVEDTQSLDAKVSIILLVCLH